MSQDDPNRYSSCPFENPGCDDSIVCRDCHDEEHSAMRDALDRIAYLCALAPGAEPEPSGLDEVPAVAAVKEMRRQRDGARAACEAALATSSALLDELAEARAEAERNWARRDHEKSLRCEAENRESQANRERNVALARVAELAAEQAELVAVITGMNAETKEYDAEAREFRERVAELETKVKTAHAYAADAVNTERQTVCALEARVAELEKTIAWMEPEIGATRKALNFDCMDRLSPAEQIAEIRSALTAERAAHEATRAALRGIPCDGCGGGKRMVRCTADHNYLSDHGIAHVCSSEPCPDCAGTGIHPAARRALGDKR
jgi:hypothetical protein